MRKETKLVQVHTLTPGDQVRYKGHSYTVVDSNENTVYLAYGYWAPDELACAGSGTWICRHNLDPIELYI